METTISESYYEIDWVRVPRDGVIVYDRDKEAGSDG